MSLTLKSIGELSFWTSLNDRPVNMSKGLNLLYTFMAVLWVVVCGIFCFSLSIERGLLGSSIDH